MKTTHIALYLLVTLIITQPARADEKSIARGRYLSILGGCNDCHTPAFGQRFGKLPEKEWLLGNGVGWNGDWGTTYSINIRKFVAPLSREQWIAFCRANKARPPMPSYVLNVMEESDLSALYDFIQSLGDAGTPAPAALPPGVEPKTPYLDLSPKNLPSEK